MNLELKYFKEMSKQDKVEVYNFVMRNLNKENKKLE